MSLIEVRGELRGYQVSYNVYWSPTCNYFTLVRAHVKHPPYLFSGEVMILTNQSGSRWDQTYGQNVQPLVSIYLIGWIQDDYRNKTRMHSSRMRTALLLALSPSMHCSGGCLLWGRSALGGSSPGGGIPACTEADPPCAQNDRHV